MSKIVKNDSEFFLETSPSDGEEDGTLIPRSSNIHSKNIIKKKPMSFQEQQLWYLRMIFLTSLAILGVMIGVLVATIIVVPVVASSNQFSRTVTLIDKVYEMHDYTKSMTDMTLSSQAKVEEALLAFDVPNMIKSIKKIVDTGSSLVNGIKTETLENLSQTSSSFLDNFKKLNFEQATELMRHANEWANVINPNIISTNLNTASELLKKSDEIMKDVKDQNLINHISQFAAGGVELEARLKRLNSFTVELPSLLHENNNNKK
jgi:hypothetical protein